MIALSLLIACQEAFEADRHDLVGDRVAAVSLDASGAEVRPRVALWVDGHPWSDAPVGLAWALVDDRDAVLDLDPEAAQAWGPSAALPNEPGRTLGLVATFPSGAVERAYVTLPDAPAAPPEISGLDRALLDLDVGTVDGAALQPDARAALSAEPGFVVPDGGFARLTAQVPDGTVARFMASGGTFFELDAKTADWAAGDLLLDDEDLEEAAPIDAGVRSLLVLAVGGSGANAFRAAELWVGEPPTGAWLGDRWIGADAPLTGAWTAVLQADDDAPSGLTLSPIAAFDGDWSAIPALPCGPAKAPFHPDLLLDGTCLRGQLVGTTVVVEAAEAPSP